MRDPHDLRLVVSGREFSGWTGSTVTMNIDAIADGFSLTAPWDPERADLRAATTPGSYKRVELYLGNDLILTGRIDKVSASGVGKPVTLEGRSLPGILADCSIDGPLEHSGLSLAQIARQLARPLGVSVRADADSDAITEARASYGETPAAYLASLAGARNFLLNSSYAGELVISRGSALLGKAPVARLVEGAPGPGETPMIGDPAMSHDGSRLFSLYRVATQFAGEPDIQGEARDAGIPVYRPRFISAGETDAQPEETAARLRSEAFASAFSLSVSVAGWRRPDGKRWAERQAVTLRAPGAMIYRETPFIIAGLVHTLTEGERKTDLRLAFGETYAGRVPEVLPWA